MLSITTFSRVLFSCRFRPKHPMPPQQRPVTDNSEDAPKRAVIISEKDLKDLEKLYIDDDGWAGAHEERDYL